MNVCNLELAKELYEVSGWETENAWAREDKEVFITNFDNGLFGHEIARIAPAYDLGYLLRKLPNRTHLYRHDSENQWSAWTLDNSKAIETVRADTPENAACKLAIELFKQGVLK